MTPIRGSRLRYADLAHTRLLMDADASHLLPRTAYEELRLVAQRHGTLDVPQVRDALRELAVRDRATVVH